MANMCVILAGSFGVASGASVSSFMDTKNARKLNFILMYR